MADDTLLSTEPTEPVTEPSTEPITVEPSNEPTGFIDKTGAFREGWLDSLPEELSDARGSLSKFRDFNGMAKSYHALEQKLGSRGNEVTVPGPDATDDQKAAYRKALGVPDAPDGYGVQKPDELPDGVEWDDGTVNDYLGVMHKHNIPPAAVKELLEMNLQVEASRAQEARDFGEQSLAEEQTKLKQEWGEKFAENSTMAKRMAATLGVELNDPVLRNSRVVSMLADMAGLVSESRLVSGDENPDLMSDADRANDIMTNSENQYHQRYREGDAKVAQMVTRLLG